MFYFDDKIHTLNNGIRVIRVDWKLSNITQQLF